MSRGRAVFVAAAAGSVGGVALALVDGVRALVSLGDQAEGNALVLFAALCGRDGVTGGGGGVVGGIINVLLDILDALFEFDDGLTHTTGDLRKARPKEQEGYNPDDDDFRSTR